MAVSTLFATKLATVAGAPSIAYVSNDTGHAELEYSYSYSGGTYTVTSSSEWGCEQGAADLLYRMGFRFYTPNSAFHIKPADNTIPTNLTRTKNRAWMFANNYGQTYGHSFPSPWDSTTKTQLEADISAWQILHGWRQGYKNGHRWTGITRVSSSGPLRQFFIDNPQLLKAGDLDSFDLENIRPGTADYNLLVEYCAARILSEPLTFFNTTNFDASDSDTNNSADVFQFSKDVCIKGRAGTAAMPAYGLTAKAGVPDLRLGVYSYAGHKTAPNFDLDPYLFVGVALGFSPPSTWAPRLAQFSEIASLVMTRDYHDTHTWSYGRFLLNSRCKSTYADTYDVYKASGCVGTHTEGSGNWLINLVSTYQFVTKLRTGSCTYAEARDEIVTNLFSGDAKVAELYDFWGNPYERFHEFNIERTCDIIDGMGEGTLSNGVKYKDMFKWTVVIVYEHLNLPLKEAVPSVGDAYDTALSKLLAHTTAMRNYDITHSYAWLRRLARGNVSEDYPWLQFEVNPKPSFYTNPYLPTEADYLAVKAELAAKNFRADDIDPSDPADLVVVHNIPSPVSSWETQAPLPSFEMRSIATYYYIGPGNITISGSVTLPGQDGEPDYTENYTDPPVYYGPGLHIINTNGQLTISCDTGMLFLKLFPETFKEDGTTGGYWVYVPERCANQVRLRGYALRLIDETNTYSYTNYKEAVDIAIGAGEKMIENNNSSGDISLINLNTYVTLTRGRHLLPEIIANEDLPAKVTVNKV